jgi:opacity protein-like surface antigen
LFTPENRHDYKKQIRDVIPMKTIIGAAMLIAAIPSAYAQSGSGEQGNYLSLSAGVTGESDFDYDFPGGNVEADTKAGFGVSAALGTHFSPNLRGEAVFSWNKAEIDVVRRIGGPQILVFEEPGDVTSYMVGGNVYWDFATSGPFRPYVGAGAALGVMDVNDRVITDASFAWKMHAMAGVDIPMTDFGTLFVEGRYESTSREVGDGLGFTEADDTLSADTVGLYAGLKFGW